MAAKSYSAIKKQIAKLEAQADRMRKNSLGKVISQIRSLMKANGITLADLETAGAGKAKSPRSKSAKPAAGKARGTVAPKYRSPVDASLQWTGRGRKPKWVQEWIDAGNDIDKLLIG